MKDDTISRAAAIDAVNNMIRRKFGISADLGTGALLELPSATDTNVGGNLIDRQAALDALGEEPPVWYDGEDEIAERDQWRRDVAAIKALPPAQPTLYGYDIKHLAFVATVMAKKGVSPEEAVTIFRDVNRVIEMMLEDMKEMQENALKQTLSCF